MKLIYLFFRRLGFSLVKIINFESYIKGHLIFYTLSA